MALDHSSEENRLLRKMISGIEMVYNSIGQHISRQSKVSKELLKLSKQKTDATEYMKRLLAINKVELLLDRIIYIQVEAPYCRVFMDSKIKSEIDLRVTIHTLEEHFDEKDLLKIHRSYLVNPKKVLCAENRGVRDYELLLKGSNHEKIALPIARSYAEKLRLHRPKWFKDC